MRNVKVCQRVKHPITHALIDLNNRLWGLISLPFPFQISSSEKPSVTTSTERNTIIDASLLNKKAFNTIDASLK